MKNNKIVELTSRELYGTQKYVSFLEDLVLKLRKEKEELQEKLEKMEGKS